MQLYSGMSAEFIDDTVHNRIAEKLQDSYFRFFGYKPAPSEVNSWRNSLRAISQVFQVSSLGDHGVLLEYRLPLSSKRLDCLVCGHDEAGKANAVIIELKQWDRCTETFGDELVRTWIGGAERDILHPSAQVRQYQKYLQDTHTAFYEGPKPIGLRSCAYLHNYLPEKGDVIFSERFAPLLSDYPTFTGDDVDNLSVYLKTPLTGGHGEPVLKHIQQSKYRPSKKLMDHVAGVIKGNPEYVLLDEQFVVYHKVLAYAQEGYKDRRKTVIIVKGGPGTGKSVIAINLMADLLLQGRNSHYATGSRAFTKTLRKIIGPRGQVQFKYFNSYVDADPNEIDVLICDEAHRIRETSWSRFTAKKKRTSKPQVKEIIDAAKVAVFFIDDKQNVRPNEIGTSDYIREHAALSKCNINEYELDVQFRCAGSEAFVDWLNNTLGIVRTPSVLWDASQDFDFQVFPTPAALDAAIRDKAREPVRARLVAGFCWPWSDPKRDGTLVDDVRIGEFRRPWNARSEAKRLAPGIPPEALWAYDPGGMDQVGCIYTAQGFEFDYVGVIFGTDLTYNLDQQIWEGNPQNSYDTVVKRSKGKFLELVKNSYRVLLSRGLKGCYVCFLDKHTERFVKSRIARMAAKG